MGDSNMITRNDLNQVDFDDDSILLYCEHSIIIAGNKCEIVTQNNNVPSACNSIDDETVVLDTNIDALSMQYHGDDSYDDGGNLPRSINTITISDSEDYKDSLEDDNLPTLSNVPNKSNEAQETQISRKLEKPIVDISSSEQSNGKFRVRISIKGFK